MLRIEGILDSIPKPIMDKLGNPDSLKFIIRDDKTIQLVPGKSVSYSGKVKHNG